MYTRNSPFRLIGVIVSTAVVVGQLMLRPVCAQDQPIEDPPTRVGRLAQLGGTVSFHTQDDSQWRAALLNYPVIAGNAFWTELNAQAVIEISASRITMAPATELDVAILTDTAFQATEPRGELYLRLQGATPDETYMVQTPRGLVSLAGSGRYGVVAGDTQHPTLVTVIEGSARIECPDATISVMRGQTARISGTDRFHGEVGPLQRDGFLTAMLGSERPSLTHGTALPPAVAAMPGGADLAQFGTWSESGDYGQVWYPEVAPGWVPYREGSWAYVVPWGWTWVDSDPWGFAPFHYGRWAKIGGRWAWIPGSVAAVPTPAYAPALVTFFGAAAGIGVAFAESRIAWCPLGPHEPFHPWYHASDRYLRQVNVGHVPKFTAINREITVNDFINQRAATVVPISTMTASRPVANSFQRVDPSQLSQARPVLGQPALRPTPTTTGFSPAAARDLGLATLPIAPHQGEPNANSAGAEGRPGAPPLHSHVPAAIPTARMHSFMAIPALTTPGSRPSTVPANLVPVPSASAIRAPDNQGPIGRSANQGQLPWASSSMAPREEQAPVMLRGAAPQGPSSGPSPSVSPFRDAPPSVARTPTHPEGPQLVHPVPPAAAHPASPSPPLRAPLPPAVHPPLLGPTVHAPPPAHAPNPQRQRPGEG
jgi:hypothetical protein